MASLCVSNLSRNVDEPHLRRVFGQFGDVTGVKFPAASSPLKRVAIVDMPDDHAAKRAIDRLDGEEVRGSRVKVEAHLAF